MAQALAEYVIVEYPGFLGRKRDEIQAGWDEKYGKGNWRLSWVLPLTRGFFITSEFDKPIEKVIPQEFAIQLYEDAYYHYFKEHPQDVYWLITNASDVYDNAVTNVESGLDYAKQESYSNHLQDIAIRRALLRCGLWFRGDHLVQVRGKDTEGARFSPYNIKFHRPELILQRPREEYGNF